MSTSRPPSATNASARAAPKAKPAAAASPKAAAKPRKGRIVGFIKALFTKDIPLNTPVGEVAAAARRPSAPAVPAAKPIPGAEVMPARPGVMDPPEYLRATVAVLNAVGAILNEQPRNRLVMRQLAAVEMIVAEGGLTVIPAAPPNLALRALEQLDRARPATQDQALLALREALLKRSRDPVVRRTPAFKPGEPLPRVGGAPDSDFHPVSRPEVDEVSHSMFMEMDAKWRGTKDVELDLGAVGLGEPPADIQPNPWRQSTVKGELSGIELDMTQFAGKR